MIKLSPRKQSILILSLLSFFVAASVLAWQYWQFRAESKRFGNENVVLLANIPYQASMPAATITRLFRSVIDTGPVPHSSIAQLVNAEGAVVADYSAQSRMLPTSAFNSDIVLKNAVDGFDDYAAYVMHGEMPGSFVRLLVGNRLTDFFKASYASILSGILPALSAIGLLGFLHGRQEQPLQKSFDLIQRLLKRVPHPEASVKRQPGVAEDLDNLALLVKSAEVYIEDFEEEKSTFNTSTKILAYQKAGSESILRSVPDGVLVLDESGQVTFANQQFLRWFRLLEANVVGKMPIDWCERPALLGFLRRYSGMLARRAESGGFETDPPGKPGASLSITAFPMFSARNEEQVNSTLIVLSDVTTEVMAQKARDDFAAALAHELKTPLHAIGMHAELLLGEEGESDTVRIESANYINTEVEHIGELVRNMLNITRIETGSLQINRKLTKLNDLLNSAVDNFATTASENQVTLHKDYSETIEPCHLDKDLLRVALNNLLSNAIKYNRSGGEVTVSCTENENNLVLSVSDNGLGISEAETARIFENFYRSEDTEVRERSGHGLGLSLVKEIVELHNGSISVESVKGEGTRFTVRLKRINVPLQEAA